MDEEQVIEVSPLEKQNMDSLYFSLNDSKMQRKIRKIKPFPVSVVYWQRSEHTLEDMKKQFKTIKELGFTSLKQICLKPDWEARRQEVELAALEAGLVPWFYGNAGWDSIEDELLRKLEIPQDLSMEEIQQHPAMLRYQYEFLRTRILRGNERSEGKIKGIRMGEPGRNMLPMPDKLLPLFEEWLRCKYTTLDNLKKAWNDEVFKNRMPVESFAQAAISAGANPRVRSSLGQTDFKRFKDAMRFLADLQVRDIKTAVQYGLEFDPEEPQRTGGHWLFDNQPLSGWDLEAQAQAMRGGGSFYSSVHLNCHFDMVEGEIDRPLYMQSRMINDFFKGGWSAIWETTGGPAIYSGTKAAGVNAGMITRQMLIYIAAGLKGIGFWCWNSRDVGWETSGHALTDLEEKPTDRAVTAGNISKALQKYRFELWEAQNNPLVGILYSWDNEATFARLSMGGFPVEQQKDFPVYPSRARIGASRALINHNISFEYITEKDIESGLAGRYKIIYLPHILALPLNVFKKLVEYVCSGGRLVADMPLLMFDEYGRLFKTGRSTVFENTFGFSLASYQHTNTIPLMLSGENVKGQFAEIKLESAEIVSTFENGRPAILERKLGKGSSAFMAFEVSSMCFEPGNTTMENILVKTVLGAHTSEWKCSMPMVYRLSGTLTDHYFFINDGEEKTVLLDTGTVLYKKAEDAVDKEIINIEGNSIQIRIPSCSGRWVRMSK